MPFIIDGIAFSFGLPVMIVFLVDFRRMRGCEPVAASGTHPLNIFYQTTQIVW